MWAQMQMLWPVRNNHIIKYQIDCIDTRYPDLNIGDSYGTY